MTTVLKIDDVWKQYRRGVINHGMLFRDLQARWAKVRGRPDPNRPIDENDIRATQTSEGDRFWALQSISMDVPQGQVLGIIGKNGAGKSTLLKLLSRTTSPTRGEIRVKGRIASLLEVGTGFHPELTGRENIFMNALLLGMKRREVVSRISDIIEFSGIGAFIDTPLKRYSSGMAVRLGFAVAAHLEAEILIVDEVLAVGDLEFQTQCIRKMDEVGRAGRTVLFVSHNMDSILALCSRAVLLERGQISLSGHTNTVVNTYLAIAIGKQTEVVWSDQLSAPGDNSVRLARVGFAGRQHENAFSYEEEIVIEIDYQILLQTDKMRVYLRIQDIKGKTAFETFNFPPISREADPLFGESLVPGLYRTVCRIPGGLLTHGDFMVGVKVSERRDGGAQALEAIGFTVKPATNLSSYWPLEGFVNAFLPRVGWATTLTAKSPPPP